ncbi:MAG: hypothetical protein CVU57_04095 [Deltaproteobacteria bacterium HGW-Deltaproteobacteria-15]|nr:MAG: hypothetical protein CVU57_04095 [Deltaproteobacteria bacterium HGW-Deltaproteobacteria-15]
MRIRPIRGERAWLQIPEYRNPKFETNPKPECSNVQNSKKGSKPAPELLRGFPVQRPTFYERSDNKQACTPAPADIEGSTK